MKEKQIEWLIWKFRGSCVEIEDEKKNMRKKKVIDPKSVVRLPHVSPENRGVVETL